jgi:hypothetical protein
VVSETWFKARLTNRQVSPSGFHVVRAGGGRRGDGVTLVWWLASPTATPKVLGSIPGFSFSIILIFQAYLQPII